MNKWALSVAISAALLLITVQAADHRDAPAVRSDPAADLNDLYAFMNPNDANELILIVTVFPDADADSRFSDAVDYNIFLENNADPAQTFTIGCEFSAEQAFNCSGPSGLVVSGDVGDTASNGGMRVFAGLRDDPFFFDSAAFNETVSTLTPSFTDPGTNAFADMNVLAIVIGIDRALVTDNFAAPVLRLWANTERTSG